MLCITVGSSSAGAQESGSDTVAYWPLDASSGSSATDLAGSNDLDLVGGPTWQPSGGRSAGALAFDGSNDFASIDDAGLGAAFPGKNGADTGDFTLMAWINPDELTDRQPIFSKQGTSESGVRRGYLLSASTSSGDGRLYFEISSGEAGSNRTVVTSDGPLASNTWQHVAVTYQFVDDGTSVITLYVDGQEVGGTSSAEGPLQANPQPLDIGRYYWSNSYSRYFDGQLDEVRVLDAALTATEITELAFGEVPNSAPIADIVVA